MLIPMFAIIYQQYIGYLMVNKKFESGEYFATVHCTGPNNTLRVSNMYVNVFW